MAGMHGQTKGDKKLLDSDAKLFMAVIQLAAREIYPDAPEPINREQCKHICA